MIGKWSKITSVLLLCFVNLINYMDRYTVSGVLPDIQDDFDINHQQGGLIQTAFIVCYFASAPIFGFLGDRYSRKILMIFGVLTWGTCTLVSSFMPTFWPFLLLRAAIGFGESGFTTLAPTVLGDLYDGSGRTLCLAFFYYAIPVGSGLGYMVGSSLANAADDWRWGLRLTPFLNFAAVILMFFFLADPPRGESEHERVQVENPAAHQNIRQQLQTWGQDLKYLLKNKSYVLSSIAFTALTFCTGVLSWWGPSFVEAAIEVRTNQTLSAEIEKENVSFIFGIVMCIAGIVGLTLGSGLSFLLRKRFAWVDPVICGGGLLISSPFLISAIATVTSGVVRSFVLMFFGQYVVTPCRRASAEAFQLMASHALGEAGSPYISGLIADQVKSNLEGSTSTFNASVPMIEAEKDYHAFQVSMYVAVGFELLSAVLFLWTTLYVVKDKERADEEERERIKANANLSMTDVSEIPRSSEYINK